MPFLIPQTSSDTPETKTNNISAPNNLQAFGVIDDEGKPDEIAFQFRGSKQLTETTRLVERFTEVKYFEFVSGRWFYGGVLHPHFGHFLTECVHRLVDFIASKDEFDGVVFLKSPWHSNWDYDPLDLDYVRETLVEYFSIPPENILLCDSPLEIEKLVVSPQYHQLGVPVCNKYLRQLGEIETTYMRKYAETTPVQLEEKIFLSRANYIASGRCLGMSAIEDAYKDNGYSIVYPESYSFREQLMLIAGAKEITVEAGSAIHIFDLLGWQKSKLTVLSRRGNDQVYWRNSYGNRVEKGYFFDSLMPIHEYTGHPPGNGHSIINPSQIKAFFQRSSIEITDESAFTVSLREATFKDMNMLNLRLPTEN